MGLSKIVVRQVKNHDIEEVVFKICQELRWDSFIKPGASIVIKLNLCEFNAAKVVNANTSKELIRALCKVLQTKTSNITLVEAHSYRAPAEIAFKNTGIYDIAEELGVNVVNLSKTNCRDIGHKILGPIPKILLDADVFINMPKLKTHCLTYFTGALKNLWGCVPRYDRIALHYTLNQLLVDLNRILKPQLCIMDGIIGMEGRGPTNGKPRYLGIVLGSTDPVALDATAMRLVGLDPMKARHVVMAFEQNQGLLNEKEILLDMNFKRNWADFEPAKLDWAVNWMNKLTKYRWFREYLLSVNFIFYPVKVIVKILRKFGIVR